MIDFEWDPQKARKNLKKHGVPFSEATTIFRDPMAITIYDPDHSHEEDRYLTTGTSTSGRILVVAHTDRGERIRLINARELTPLEHRAYEQEAKRRR